MDLYRNDKAFAGFQIRKKLVDIYEGHHTFQTIVPTGPHVFAPGIEFGDFDDDDDDDDEDYENDWMPEGVLVCGCGQCKISPSGHPPPFTYISASRHLSPVKVIKESEADRKSKLLQENKKIQEKAEKRRLKKQRQKQRKQLEKSEKKEQNPEKTSEESNMDENNESKELAPAQVDSGSSSSGDEEEHCSEKEDGADSADDLDMTSTFVNMAALRVQRKMEQKAGTERKEKRSPAKTETHLAPEKARKDPATTKAQNHQDSAVASSLSLEDNIKMSTHLAILGNKYASAGALSMAVKCFTNAIQYNPTEYKLFGNRSFCFEKMKEYEKALADAELSLSICPGWMKGLFRKGRALAGLKRYKEASDAFQEVLKLDCSYAEAAQELMRVRTFELMSHGFTQEQSLNALIIHGTVEKSLEVLTKLTKEPIAVGNGTLSPHRGANSGQASALRPSARSQEAPKAPVKREPAPPPVQNSPTNQDWRKPANNSAAGVYKDKEPKLELFPIWVGNLENPVSEESIQNLFSRVGAVHSVRVLTYKRCAFVNYTKRKHCDKAIGDYNGYILNNNKLVVRFPDRIPQGMGMSKSAVRAEDIEEDDYGDQAYGNHYRRSYRPDRRGFFKY